MRLQKVHVKYLCSWSTVIAIAIAIEVGKGAAVGFVIHINSISDLSSWLLADRLERCCVCRSPDDPCAVMRTLPDRMPLMAN
jgi:hypothetical protein